VVWSLQVPPISFSQDASKSYGYGLSVDATGFFGCQEGDHLCHFLHIGPGTSHKVLAVEYMIQRKNEHEIARIIYHSLHSIERYTISFSRIVLLKEKGLSVEDIAFVVQLSKRLVSEYLSLYNKYKQMPQYKERLDEIVGKVQNFDKIISKESVISTQCKKQRSSQ